MKKKSKQQKMEDTINVFLQETPKQKEAKRKMFNDLVIKKETKIDYSKGAQWE